MKKFLLFVLLGQAACAAPGTTPSPVITLQKAAAPANSSRFKPRGSKLLRSVTAPAGNAGGQVSLLFYGRRPKPNTKRPFQVADDSLLVDVQIVERKKVRKKWQLKLLRIVPLGFCEDWIYNGTELRWLNAARKTGPILKVPRIEADELIVFPKGWTQKTAVRQVFGRSASSIAAIYYKFDKVDENSIFVVTEVVSERTEGGQDDTPTDLTWNGKGWKGGRGGLQE